MQFHIASLTTPPACIWLLLVASGRSFEFPHFLSLARKLDFTFRFKRRSLRARVVVRVDSGARVVARVAQVVERAGSGACGAGSGAVARMARVVARAGSGARG